MKKTLPVVLTVGIIALLMLFRPEPAFAQRGGHGGGFHGGGGSHGGGGFHGGGSFHGGGGFHSGGSFHGGGGFHGGGAFRGSGTAFRGGAFRGGTGWRGSGFRGGFRGRGFNRGWGWRGRGWGWGGWGWGGWGWGLGFGWGWPYYWDWPGYSYPYGYWYDAPPYYGGSYDYDDDPDYAPYDPPRTYRHRDNGNTNPPQSDAPPNSIDRLPPNPPKDSSAPSPDRPPSANPVTTAAADFQPPDLPRTTEVSTISASGQLERSSAPRREVLNAMRALREMPPFAREREIDHGRYSNFSAEERDLLRTVGQ